MFNVQKSSSGGNDAGKKNVLIVDDALEIRVLVAKVLERGGFSTRIASNGAEALEILNLDPRFDLIVLDMDMPCMNGLETAKRIRGKKSTAKIPILVLTSDSNEEAIRIAKDAGVQGWMVKAFSPDELISACQRLAV